MRRVAPEPVIRTEGLTKHYGPVVAVQDVSLGVSKGEIYGFLGMNGAGKTTTIRLLLGMVRPTRGACFLFGQRVTPSRHNLWARVGYIVETPHSYPDLTVTENLEVERRLRGIDKPDTVDAIIEQLKLGPYRSRKVKNLSTGNAQRLGLARALLHKPELLLLDEPTSGLDPAGIVEIRELLRDLAQQRGVTIFISSHILSEISKLASRIGIIHEGRLVLDTDADHLESQLRKRLVVDSRDQEAARRELVAAGYTVDSHAGKLVLRDPGAIAHPDRVAALLAAAGQPPTLLMVDEEDLESYFLRIIGVTEGAAT